jgi:muramoyltetrapeptide carboxypeptidase
MNQNRFSFPFIIILYRLLLLIFVFQSFHSQAQKNMITPPSLQKEIPLLYCTEKNIDDNLKNDRFTTQLGGLKSDRSTIGLDNQQEQMQTSSRFSSATRQSEYQSDLVCKGGYGTVRIIDLLDFTAFKKHPKWIVGFSDVTVLHNHLNTLGYKSIHGIMPIAARATTYSGH